MAADSDPPFPITNKEHSVSFFGFLGDGFKFFLESFKFALQFFLPFFEGGGFFSVEFVLFFSGSRFVFCRGRSGDNDSAALPL